MIKTIINSFKNLDKKIKNIMNYGLIFAFIISILSTIILSIYILFNSTSILYYTGIYTFKFSLIIATEFIICGYAIDRILNRILIKINFEIQKNLQTNCI